MKSKTTPIAQDTIIDTPKPVTSKRNPWLLIGGLLLLVAVAAYQLKGLFIKAIVNGKPLYRSAYIQALETKDAGITLNNMIDEQLIQDEATKQNLSVPQADIDNEIATIQENLKADGQDFNEALKAQNLTLEDLQKLVRIRGLVTQLTTGKVTVTDDEVKKFLTDNKAYLPTPKAGEPSLEEQAKAQLEQQKQQEYIQTWLTELRAKANVQYW